ncbi:MAG: LysM peptidoglycan-binding domain-containing protein [Rhodospirillaceae bacterium]|nr:LysM peptidoglycan-binding domain-containing protein [Rhodospirillaceae bacterium]MBT4939930.1 LysM peptidoglycan-binding domain-containing protein [Rhodospirillaceae bacterium]MBT5939058.1 LysM peptidoglycan-binding domain-containing protein [Rhodospirillaceae bacterium]MBT7269148.1 LysM peptidoglycan-binding domain-containing protein [Rhodospirillaceae bacterium]
MSKSAILAIIGGFAVAAAIALNFVLESPEETASQKATPKAQSQGKSKTKITAPIKADPKKAENTTPSFDIVRITPQGDTVMAGRASPGAKVEIYDGSKKIGEVTADKRGEWVFVPSSPLPPGSRQLSLKMINPDGSVISSESDVVLVVPEKGKDIAGKPTDEPSQPLAMKVPTKPGGRLEILQKPKADADISLTIDAVDYDDSGQLDIIGKAPAEATVNLYLNNEFLGRGKSNDRGLWRQTPDRKVKAGMYTVRADHVGKDGKVKSRMEVVFARSVPLTGIKPGTLVVVESGHSLWRIARKTYGTGFRYTVIYEANKKQIKDPNLIFPGQVFALPSVN